VPDSSNEATHGQRESRAARPATAVVVTRIELPARTIAKIVLTLALLWLLGRLWTLLVLLAIALLLAAALEPVIERLERRRWRRGLSVGLVVLVLLGVVSLVLVVLVPPVARQTEEFALALPGYVDHVERFVYANPAIGDRVGEVAGEVADDAAGDPTRVVAPFLAVGTGLVQAITNLVVLFALTVYLLLDGERVIAWAARLLPVRHRAKVRRMLPEVSRVVGGYLLGLSINSVLFGAYSFVVLSLLGVPEPLLLAILSALLNVVPMFGMWIAIAISASLALTVSWPAAALVVALLLGYQQVENYLISPRVFGGTLRISPFAVLFAILVGGYLLGVIGVILALPIAAAIPPIERIWREEAAAGEENREAVPN